jgi:hypothetical protein
MMMARALEVGEQSGFATKENHALDDQNGDYLRSPVPERARELGKIYLEARVQDDFMDDLTEVGYCSQAIYFQQFILSRYTTKLCGSSLFILSKVFP